MEIIAVKTKIFLPGESSSLEEILAEVPRVQERDIVIITSKIISICQGRVVDKQLSEEQFFDLVRAESDSEEIYEFNERLFLCAKFDSWLMNAGIDGSNSGDSYVLPIKNEFEVAGRLWKGLAARDQVREFGLIIADSRSLPKRLGTQVFAIAWSGMKALHDYRGGKDLFEHTINYTRLNIVDSIAAFAGLWLGEGNEQTPIVMIRELEKDVFAQVEVAGNELGVAAGEDVFEVLKGD
jgi:F420-0:gamma-glutamyl ligase